MNSAGLTSVSSSSKEPCSCANVHKSVCVPAPSPRKRKGVCGAYESVVDAAEVTLEPLSVRLGRGRPYAPDASRE